MNSTGATVLRVVFFHAKPGLSARLPVGSTVRVVGMLRDGATGPELVQPKVLYAYADPTLEARSSGQKILMRMGPANAERVKAKLREIRALVATLPPKAAE